MTASKQSGDKPQIAFTLEQIEQEAQPDIEPLRMGVKGKVIELKSPMAMEASSMATVLEAMNASAQMGELGDAAAMIQLLPAMIGEENYQTLLDAKVTIAGLMKIQEKVEAYYEAAFAAVGVDDPKDSSSQ
ncbi:MAG: hypothetical protein ACTIA5_01405 [Brachybacterium tyrofermentans]